MKQPGKNRIDRATSLVELSDDGAEKAGRVAFYFIKFPLNMNLLTGFTGTGFVGMSLRLDPTSADVNAHGPIQGRKPGGYEFI